MADPSKKFICNVKGHRQCDCWMGMQVDPQPEHPYKDYEEQLEPHCRRCGCYYEGKVIETDVSAQFGLPPGSAIDTEFEDDEE